MDASKEYQQEERKYHEENSTNLDLQHSYPCQCRVFPSVWLARIRWGNRAGRSHFPPTCIRWFWSNRLVWMFAQCHLCRTLATSSLWCSPDRPVCLSRTRTSPAPPWVSLSFACIVNHMRQMPKNGDKYNRTRAMYRCHPRLDLKHLILIKIWQCLHWLVYSVITHQFHGRNRWMVTAICSTAWLIEILGNVTCLRSEFGRWLQ